MKLLHKKSKKKFKNKIIKIRTKIDILENSLTINIKILDFFLLILLRGENKTTFFILKEDENLLIFIIKEECKM